MDSDEDGNLGLQDVQDTLAKGGVAVPHEEDVIALFNAADVNQTSYIDFAKFAAIMIDQSRPVRYTGSRLACLPCAACELICCLKLCSCVACT